MSGKLQFEIVTPERRVLQLEADEVVLPSNDGSMGVLPGHAPLLARLDAGEASYRVGSTRHYLAVSGGFAEVEHHRVSVLARTAEKAEEIDLERATAARSSAEKALQAHPTGDDLQRAEVRLKRAISRIQVRQRIGN